MQPVVQPYCTTLLYNRLHRVNTPLPPPALFADPPAVRGNYVIIGSPTVAPSVRPATVSAVSPGFVLRREGRRQSINRRPLHVDC